jgi:hypothetical protein
MQRIYWSFNYLPDLYIAGKAHGQHLSLSKTLFVNRYHQDSRHVLSTACPKMNATALGNLACLSFADATAAIGQASN